MSPGSSHENRHPGLPRSSSRSLVIGAAGAERTIRQRLRKLHHTPADNGSKASSAETYGATYQQGDVSQGAQNMRESAFENLPEDILHHIHSLLDVQDAARAACVSRVFLRSWRCYSDLILCHQTLGWDEEKYGEREIKFIGKVDRILENHYRNGVKLKTLYLILHPFKNISASYLDRWLQNAVKSGIEKLSLILYPVIEENSYSFPCSVLSDKEAASSIQDLRLFYCAFDPTSALGCLKRLKSLNLGEVHITEEGFGHLLSKSFVLERLVVSSCSGIICLRIPSTLQHLKLICIRTCEMLQVLEIDAPNVCTFHYSGTSRVKISVRNSSQLIKNVDMCSDNRSAPGILSYARASLTSVAPNVESLTLHSRKENVDTSILPFKLIHLKKLEIGVLRSLEAFSPSYDAFSVVSFLDASPVLDSFILRVERYAVSRDPVVRDDEKYSRRKPECRYDSLRQVTITGFSSAKSLVELTIHILESAPSLERLTLDTTNDYSRNFRCCASREIGQCWPMSERALAEARSAVEAASRYIAGRIPRGVKFEVLEPPSGCHTGNP